MLGNLSHTIRLSEGHRESLANRTTHLMQDIHDALTGFKLKNVKSMPLAVELGEINGKRPVSPRFQAFSGCQFQGMSSSMRLIL